MKIELLKSKLELLRTGTVYRRFGRTYCFHLLGRITYSSLKIKAINPSENLANIKVTACRHNPEDDNPHRRENLKARIIADLSN
jgi:hypothetical protein